MRTKNTCVVEDNAGAQTQSTPVDDHVDGGPRRPRPISEMGVVAVEGAIALRRKGRLMRSEGRKVKEYGGCAASDPMGSGWAR